MATWGLHIRIADVLLNMGYTFEEKNFVVGNIGPDCGQPNEDWSKFNPPTEISHWCDEGRRNIRAYEFYDAYLKGKIADINEKSFLIGYYIHLLADIEWGKLYRKKKDEDELYSEVKTNRKFIWTIKKDWYDLDHLYFRENPDSIFFRVFKNVRDIPDYLDYYPPGAIIKRVGDITRLYMSPPDNLDRDYIYMSKEEMDEFLLKTVDIIHRDLMEKGLQ